MDFRETKLLLAEASAVDNRNVEDETVQAWTLILHDVTLAEAQQALREHRRTSTEYLQPAHIVQIVTRARRDANWDHANSRPFPPPGKRYAVDVIEGIGELE